MWTKMNAGLWINVYFLLLRFASAIILPCEYGKGNPFLYRQLENALLDSPNGLHALHTAFFVPNRVSRGVVRIHLQLKVNQMEPFECSGEEQALQPPVEHTESTSDNNGTQLHEYTWFFKWSSSAVLSQINVAELMAFDNVIVPILYSGSSTSINHVAKVALYIPSLPCTLADKDILSTLTVFFTWVKAYARDQRRPITWKDEDRGYISFEYNYWISEGLSDSCKFDTAHLIHISLLVAYISLSLLIPILLTKVSGTYYLKISQNILIKKQTRMSITLWAAIIVLTIINTVYFLSSILLYVIRNVAMGPHAKDYFNYSGTSLYTDCMAAFASRIIITPLVYILELLIAALTPKNTGLPVPSVIQKTLFCRVCFSSSMRSKIIQTLVVWNIMIFIQGLAMSAIPICIFLLINPLWTISILGSFACLVLFVVVVVAYLLYQCTAKQSQKHRCKRYTIICLKITGSILSLLITFHLLAVYFIVINISGGAIGFLASFLPPAILSIIGLCLKKKLSGRSFQETPYYVHAPQEEVQMNAVGDTEPLID